MTPLVFLPGMMCDARLFAPQMAALSSVYPVMVAPITGHDTVEALAQSVLIAAPKTFALAGLSMGGIVAMEVIRQAPDRVEKLALMDTNPKAELEALKQGRAPQMERVKSGDLESLMHEVIAPNYLPDRQVRGDILELCVEMAMDLGPEVFLRQSRALMARPDQQETLKLYEKQTLVLTGHDDRLCPMERHTLMADLLPNATLHVVHGAGHLPTLEQPEQVTRALRDWLGD